MRAWHVIVASALAAGIVDAALLLAPGVPSRAEIPGLLLARWPTLTVVWLGCYGIIALALTTLALFVEIGDAARQSMSPEQFRRGWARAYLTRLATAQYFTALFALFGLGLSGVPLGPTPFAIFPVLSAISPALAAWGAVLLAGLLGVLAVAAAVAAREPVAVAMLPMVEPMQLRLLHEILEALRAQNAAAPHHRAPAEAELGALVEQHRRSVLEAIQELASAVTRLSRRQHHSFEEIRAALEAKQPAPGGGEASATAALENTAAEMRAVAASIEASVGKLVAVASALAATQEPPAFNSAAPRQSLEQVSADLQELLREMDAEPVENPGEEAAPGRPG